MRLPPRLVTLLHAILWIAVALPAAYQIYTLGTAIAHRLTYPYDLEWMEGGLLVHAERIRAGLGIYVPPSIDFIPYLYTPLYPTTLALFGGGFGLDYTLGRAISVVGLLGIAAVVATSLASRRHEHRARGPVWAGIALALGLFAAVYPFTKAWYDLVRADTVFLWMVTAGIAGLASWSRESTGLRGHGKVAAGAALLALAFFCKQTGILYVAFGGLVVLVLAWRRAFTYTLVAGAIGLGFVAIMSHTTRGWFWIYVSKVHRAHDFNMDRFYGGFGRILWHMPVMTSAIGVALALAAITWWRRRAFPAPAFPLVLWSGAYAVSTLVGALGIATEWSVENAFIPAFLHGAIAAGAAVPAVAGCARLLLEPDDTAPRSPRVFAAIVPTVAAVIVAGALAHVCYRARWSWRTYSPTRADREAGDRLITRLRTLPGTVWMPSHPWYLRMAGKTPFVHRMGVKDVTARKPRPIEALDASIKAHAFDALVLDNNDLHIEQQPELVATSYLIRKHYRPSLVLPPSERPRLFSGSTVMPFSIWHPVAPANVPAGATVVFDFEVPSWPGWERAGAAWNNVNDAVQSGKLIAGTSGERFALSDDKSVGRVTSPDFVIPADATQLTMRLGGGVDPKLRVELRAGGAVIGTAQVAAPGGDQLATVAIEVTAARGKRATLVLIDDSPRGHLVVDDVWMIAGN